jgi:hypothetical protein
MIGAAGFGGGLALCATLGFAQPQSGDSAIAYPKLGAADTLAAAPASPVPPVPKPIEPPDGATPVMVLSQVERGWRTGAPEMVVGCFANEGVEIECDRSGAPAGRFPCPQAEFLIRDLLHYGETIDFHFTRFEWKGDNPKAEAEWVHRMGAAERKLQVEIELAKVAEGWRVVRLTSH